MVKNLHFDNPIDHSLQNVFNLRKYYLQVGEFTDNSDSLGLFAEEAEP